LTSHQTVTYTLEIVQTISGFSELQKPFWNFPPETYPHGYNDLVSLNTTFLEMDYFLSLNVTTERPHHPSSLARFSEWYEGVHGYVSFLVCVFGIAANVMNIIVLTRKGMITPTNTILTALATADLLTMLSYLPYAIYFHCISSPDPSHGHPQG